MRLPVRLPRDTRGTALVIVLFLIAALAGLIAATAPLLVDALRTSMSRSAARGTRDAAGSAVAVLRARLTSLAAERLGDLGQADLDALAASVSTLPAPGAGMTLLTGPAETGVILQGVRLNHPLAYDETPQEALTDQPRRRWDAIPPVGGLVASQTLDFLVFATVEGPGGARSTAREVVSVSRVPPHQDALYVAGDGEICATGGSVHRIHGTVRVDGSLRLDDCGGTVEYTGGIELTGDLRVDGAPGLHQLAGEAGAVPLTSLASGAAEMDPDAATAPWGGRLRMAGALGGRLPSTRFATAAVAGSGECLDFAPGGDEACGGAAAYHPTLQVWGDGLSPAYRCGAGWGGAGCAPAAALTWTPWPFAGGVDVAAAQPDPADPGRLWKGLYPDARREARCTATVAGTSWRTFRCPTNAWGWTLDAGALPALPGGLLSVARSAGLPPEANPDGAREVLLVRNAAEIAGPLTIHSQVPVVLVGSFNVVDPKPAMIHAPRITVLPAEAELALRTTSVWDSVAATGGGAPRALPLVAQSNVTIYAVLRLQTCRRVGAADYGGSWRAAPAVLGDWSRVGLRVIGAVQVEDRTSDGSACASWGAPLNQAPPSGTPTLDPRSRELLYDPRLLHPGFQPPGSWTAANIPAPSAAGTPSRTPARQTHAIGGTAVLRISSTGATVPFRLPPVAPFPGPQPLPSPPPPLP